MVFMYWLGFGALENKMDLYDLFVCLLYGTGIFF